MYSAPHKPYTKTQATYIRTLSYYTSIALCRFSWTWMICLTILIKSQTSDAGAPIENIEQQSTTCHESPYLSASLMHALTWLYTCRIFPRHPRKTWSHRSRHNLVKPYLRLSSGEGACSLCREKNIMPNLLLIIIIIKSYSIKN